MKKIIPLMLLAFSMSLTACNSDHSGGGNQALNVTGSWNGSLQTTTGGGLGAVEVNLTQSPAPATDFKGTLSTPMFGGNHPLVGDAAKGTLRTDLSSGNINMKAAISCTGTFTNTSYRGNCTLLEGDGTFVIVLSKK